MYVYRARRNYCKFSVSIIHLISKREQPSGHPLMLLTIHDALTNKDLSARDGGNLGGEGFGGYTGDMDDQDQGEAVDSGKARYHAAAGCEDRHGEMTGAISVNMVLCGLPLILFIFLLNPLIFESVDHQAIAALVVACGLFFGMFPISRRIWAWISKLMDNPDL